jgi:3-deoxy-D-manno-octulosonic-acid transferase
LSGVYNFLMSVFRLLLPLGRLAGGKTALFVTAQSAVKKDIEFIKGWRSSFKNQPLIWFHAASLGEFEQGRPVLEEFKNTNPSYKVLLTFFSPSGYEVRKNYPNADYITYLPLDTASQAKAFLEAAKPQIVVFIKYEFWPNFIREIKTSGAALVGISIILRKDQSFFKPWGEFFRKALKSFDFLFVQNPESGALLNSIGYRDYNVAGDTRFDRVIATAKDNAEVQGIEKFISYQRSGFSDQVSAISDQVSALNPQSSILNPQSSPIPKVMVVGSAWPEDMEVLKPFMKKHSEMKFIIAPHEIKSEQINDWVRETEAILYSQFDTFKGENVLILDSIGLLSKLYKYADYAFVGGGFKTGLHNILEPAVFGVPIFFGNKKYKKFQEANDLLSLGVAFAINENLDEVFEDLDLEEIKAKASEYVNRNSGATVEILKYLETSST